MDARELRIGSLVNNYGMGTPVLIDIRPFHFSTFELNIGMYEPIPLTEEWLIKLGFEKTLIKFNDNSVLEALLFNGFVVQKNSMYQGWIVSRKQIDQPFKIHYLNSILYVHQLQNLYFALTGEELIIK